MRSPRTFRSRSDGSKYPIFDHSPHVRIEGSNSSVWNKRRETMLQEALPDVVDGREMFERRVREAKESFLREVEAEERRLPFTDLSGVQPKYDKDGTFSVEIADLSMDYVIDQNDAPNVSLKDSGMYFRSQVEALAFVEKLGIKNWIIKEHKIRESVIGGKPYRDSFGEEIAKSASLIVVANRISAAAELNKEIFEKKFAEFKSLPVRETVLQFAGGNRIEKIREPSEEKRLGTTRYQIAKPDGTVRNLWLENFLTRDKRFRRKEFWADVDGITGLDPKTPEGFAAAELLKGNLKRLDEESKSENSKYGRRYA